MQPKWFNYLYPVSYVYPASSSGAPYSTISSSSSSVSLPRSMHEDKKVDPTSHVRHTTGMTSRTRRGRQTTKNTEPAGPTVPVHPASSSSSASLPQSMHEDKKVDQASHVRHTTGMTSRTGRGRQTTTNIEPAGPTVPVHPVFYWEPFQAGLEAEGMHVRSGPEVQGGSMPMSLPVPPKPAHMYHDNAKAPQPTFDGSFADDVEKDLEEEPLELSSWMQRRLLHTLVDPPLVQQKKRRVSDDTEDHGPLHGLEHLAAFNALGLIF